MKKPRLLTACVANHHTAPGERIAEFSFFDGTGGLISLRQPTIDRRGRVEVYRTDGAVEVIGPKHAARDAAMHAAEIALSLSPDRVAELIDDPARAMRGSVHSAIVEAVAGAAELLQVMTANDAELWQTHDWYLSCDAIGARLLDNIDDAPGLDELRALLVRL